ncbi:MAG: SGNH/GDSL hydrolase family protein [Gemmatimonadaceae bacterium]
MSRLGSLLLSSLSLAVISACADAPPAPLSPLTPTAAASRGGDDDAHTVGAGRLRRYVALGTSVSMGVADAGILFSAQQQSWPAQLARLAGTESTEPLIQAPGCAPPLLPPLASGVRINGDPAAGSTVCSPLMPGVTLPVANVAIDGSITHEALYVTPEIAATYPNDALRGPLFSRVLRPGHTQVSEMIAQHPKFVSVELGANELLRARAGVLIDGFTRIPYADWEADYDRVIAAVRSTRARALLVGLASQLDVFPSFRYGREIGAARAQFAGIGVTVAADCDGSARDNVLFTLPIILGKAAEAQYKAPRGLETVLSCADVPNTFDYILTPSDIAQLNAQMARMNAHIRALAEANDYAYMELGTLYGPTLKAPFNLNTFLFSPQPFGPLISLDGLHPSAAGHAILANAAAHAIGLRRESLVASTNDDR